MDKTQRIIFLNNRLNDLIDKNFVVGSLIDKMREEIQEYIKNPHLTPGQRLHAKIRTERLEQIEGFFSESTKLLIDLVEESKKPNETEKNITSLKHEISALKNENDHLKNTLNMFGLEGLHRYTHPDKKEFLREQSILKAQRDFNI